MQVLTEEEMQSRLEPLRVIQSIEEAFRTRYRETLIPLRSQIPLAGGTLLIMPCYDRQRNALGMKLVMVASNPATPEDRLHASFLLLAAATGSPTLMMSARYLTELRTAATSAVATKFLARSDVRVLGVFGTGRQARAHLKVLRLVRDFQHILVSGLDPVASREFAQQMAGELGVPVESVFSRTCAAESDVLCTCTTSAKPLFDGHLLRAGTHLNLIGSFQPHTQEVDETTIERSRVVVDTYEGALAEAGDLIIPLQKGVIRRSHILADLHELVSGRKKVRSSPEQITLFKSVGCALEDLVTAELADDSR